MAPPSDMRALLLRMGVSDFNATQMIPILFMGPAQTDADMPPVILLVEAFQRNLNAMGASLPVTGRMTPDTVLELRKITGTAWPRMRWFEIANAIRGARESGMLLKPGITDGRPMRHARPMGNADGLGLSDPFPMPGGLLGWAAVGALVYWYFTGKTPLDLGRKALGRGKPAHRRTTVRSS